jgi:uracil-DNA glycosylase family 4
MRFNREGISLCQECPLNDRRRVWGEGDHEGKIVIIGEGPGRTEELEGSPFIGGAGKELTSGLVQAGIFRRGIWISNVISCRPPGNDIDSEEGREAVRCCKAGFEKELENCRNARVFIPVGNVACAALGIVGRITQIRGSVYELPKSRLEQVGGREVGRKRYACPTWHPAYILRDRKNKGVWIADLKKAKEISNDGWKPPTENFNLFPTLEDVEAFRRKLQKDPLVGVDIETTSLNPKYGSIVVVGLAKRGGNVLTVPLLKQGGGEYWSVSDHKKVFEELQAIFNEGKLVFHNALFDADYLECKGWKVPNIHEDTMLLHHAVHPELSHKLGFVVSIYGETPYWKGEFLKREVGILDLPDEDLRRYNARDAAVLLEILPGLKSDAEELHVYQDIYRDISLQLIKPVLAMERRGILLSQSRLGTWKRNLDLQISKLDEDLKRRAQTPKGFNLDSDTDLRLLIFGWKANKFSKAEKELLTYQDGKRRKDTKHYRQTLETAKISRETGKLFDLKLKASKLTSTKMPSVDEESLLLAGLHLRARLDEIDHFIRQEKFSDEKERIRNGISWLSDFRNYSERVKLRSTYTSFPTDAEGAVHTSYLIHGTTSGRLASRDPNLQNQPLEARKLFVSRNGFIFVGRDYSNLELRIAGILSGDSRMLDAFERGDNLHDLNTQGLFNIRRSDPSWDAARKASKIYVFGRRLYGGSSRGIYLKVLAEVPELELTYGQFQRFDSIFDGMYPTLARWQRSIKAEVLGTKKVRNAFGRLRIFRGQTAEIEREGLNHPIQSTAADLVNRATIAIHNRFPAGYGLVLQIHDELVSEVPLQKKDEASKILQEEMEKEVLIDGKPWSFPTEEHVGTDWGKLK